MGVRIDQNLSFTRASVSLVASSTNHNYATTHPFTRLGVAGGATAFITGLANPAPGSTRLFTWDGVGSPTFLSDTGSTSGLRLKLGVPSMNLAGYYAIMFVFDGVSGFWRPL